MSSAIDIAIGGARNDVVVLGSPPPVLVVEVIALSEVGPRGPAGPPGVAGDASTIPVVPPVAGASDVQAALVAIDAKAEAALQAVFFSSATFIGDALTAPTQLDLAVADGGTF